MISPFSMICLFIRIDIVIKNNRDKKCALIDVAIPCDKNTPKKISKKLSKYKDLEIEISRECGR